MITFAQSESHFIICLAGNTNDRAGVRIFLLEKVEIFELIFGHLSQKFWQNKTRGALDPKNPPKANVWFAPKTKDDPTNF